MNFPNTAHIYPATWYYHFQVTATLSFIDITFIEGQGTDGIFIQSARTVFGPRRINFHHFELDTGVIYSYNVFHGTCVYNPDNSCTEDSISLHSPLPFIVLCSTAAAEEQAYFLHSVDYYDGDPLPLYLSPLSQRSYIYCGMRHHSQDIYEKCHRTIYHSKTFSSKIVSHSYLNSATVKVDTGSRQHIVNVDAYMATGGREGVLTLDDKTNCTRVQKIIKAEVYATACRDDTIYDVRLVNKTNSQRLAPVINLTRKTLDVYFAPTQPIPGPPSSPPNTLTPITRLSAITSTIPL